MIVAKSPFRYGKEGQHWKFNANDIIKDKLLLENDIKKLLEMDLIDIVSGKQVGCICQETTENSTDENIVVQNNAVFDYLNRNVSDAKELIAVENNLKGLLHAKAIEEKQQAPRKTITEAIKRRVLEITGKRIQ